MKTPRILSLVVAVAALLPAMGQTPVVHFDMSLDGTRIHELVSAVPADVVSQLPPVSVTSPDGQALRFDGYSNYVVATIPSATLTADRLTMAVTLAAESYPMMQADVAEQVPTYATVCGNVVGNKGFALGLSSQGDLQVEYFTVYGGNSDRGVVKGTRKLPRGQWSRVVVTFDKSADRAALYLDGQCIGESDMAGQCPLAVGDGSFYIGKDATEKRAGRNLLNTFCGLIDDIALYNEVTVPDGSLSGLPDFAYPASRYADNLWRPRFHAMPTGSWTNETHGFVFSGGKYHVFFQKNPNGPYMSRLHWGHLTSTDLCSWTEEPIAVYPEEWFDIKGCWSGCVYDDGGTPTILYTAVDNERARIVRMTATDATLATWQDKQVVIDGRPAGLSDDFRDPYHFTAGGQEYIIVGTSQNGAGTCTLHRRNGTSWTNDGTTFFHYGASGRFWEMPNVTPMGGDKYLFTCTPLDGPQGVQTLCWVGTIGSDGRFVFGEDDDQQYLEMNGIGRQGYGLLSPSFCQAGGKTLLLGIVPDKLPGDVNYTMGWAHNYSLPRELSLAADGTLVQQPYSGLTALRTATTVSHEASLDGVQPLSPVSGRQLELQGSFTVGTSGQMGFRFLKNGNHYAELSYDASTGRLKLDLTMLERTVNDQGIYNGVYDVALPQRPAAGSELKLHVFLDGSVADIFVNDRWAYSVRLFPIDVNAVDAEVFATVQTPVKVSAWTLDAAHGTGIQAVHSDRAAGSDYCYNLGGQRVQRPTKGIYIFNRKKYVAR